MILPIVTNKKELRKRCTPIAYQLTAPAVADLLDTANSLYDKCDGLAANQIGHSVCIIAVKLSNGFEIMINPEYIEKTGAVKWGNEGCMSRPSTIKSPVRVKRHYKVKIKYTDVNGDVIVVKFKNYFARLIQHEMDHLDGVLI